MKPRLPFGGSEPPTFPSGVSNDEDLLARIFSIWLYHLERIDFSQLRCIGLWWPLTNYFHYGLISHKPCSSVPSHLMPLPAWHQWWCLLTTLQRPKTAETGGAPSTEQRRQVVLGGQWFDPRVGPSTKTGLTIQYWYCLGLKKKPTFAQDRAWLFLFLVGWEQEDSYQGEGCGQTWWFLRLRLCGSWDVNFKRSPLSALELCFAEPALCRWFNVYIYISYIYIYIYLVSLILICVFISIFIHIHIYIYLLNSLETWRQVTGRMSMGGAFKLLSAPAQKSTKTPTSKMSSFNWETFPPTAIYGGPPYFPGKIWTEGNHQPNPQGTHESWNQGPHPVA